MIRAAFQTCRNPIVPVFHNVLSHHSEILAKIIESRGLCSISLRHREALDALLQLRNILPHDSKCMLGASTVVSEKQIRQVKDGGADFISTTFFASPIMQIAKENNMPMLAGVSTLEESQKALIEGASALKFYPSSKVSPERLERILSALRGDERILIDGKAIFISGGVEPKDFSAYLKAGATHICIGFDLLQNPIHTVHEKLLELDSQLQACKQFQTDNLKDTRKEYPIFV